MRHHAFWFGACSTLFLTSCSNSTGPRIEKLREALAQAEVSLRESVAAGESSVTGSKAIKARLLVVSDPEYSVGALGNGMLHDVRIDIVSGSVIISAPSAPSPIPAPVPSRSPTPLPLRKRRWAGRPLPSSLTTTITACVKSRCSPLPSCGK